MFTGIITDIGKVVDHHGGQFELACGYARDTIEIGASIACNGVCLTVTALKPHDRGTQFVVDVSNETKSRTTIESWHVGTNVNLERALQLGDELGGHMVTGHVDGTAAIVSCVQDGDSKRFELDVDEELSKFVAEKGSVALDGTSLTVNAASGCRFSVNIIPHTLTHTTWGRKTAGDQVNIEVDMFARYVSRMMEFGR